MFLKLTLWGYGLQSPLNEPEISDSRPQLKSHSRRTSAQDLIHRPQPDLNSRTLDLEASTLPRDHRGQPGKCYSFLPFLTILFAILPFRLMVINIENNAFLITVILFYLIFLLNVYSTERITWHNFCFVLCIHLGSTLCDVIWEGPT